MATTHPLYCPQTGMLTLTKEQAETTMGLGYTKDKWVTVKLMLQNPDGVLTVLTSDGKARIIRWQAVRPPLEGKTAKESVDLCLTAIEAARALAFPLAIEGRPEPGVGEGSGVVVGRSTQ